MGHFNPETALTAISLRRLFKLQYLLLFFLLAASLEAADTPELFGGFEQQVPPLELSASWETEGKQTRLLTNIQIPQGYHLNRDLLEVRAGDWGLGPLQYPPISGEVQGIRYYDGKLQLQQAVLSISPEDRRRREQPAQIELELQSQICDEEGNCFLPQQQSYQLQVNDVFWQDLAKPQQTSVLWLLLLSLLGGIILNFMPCVFPIFSLKLQNLLQMLPRSEKIKNLGRYRQGLGSIFFSLLGIELSFAVLGFVLLVVSRIQDGLLWGFQFQQPLFIYGLLLLLFIMALSLLGLVRLQAPHLPQAWLPKKTVATAIYDIWHGALIVLLGTPCSAPLLAPLFGLYLLQGRPSLGISGLLLVGLGMWLPYAILGVTALRRQKPLGNLANALPHIEIILGFVLLGAVVYLYGLLQNLLDARAVIALWSLLLIAWLAWLWRRLEGRQWRQHKIRAAVYFLSFLLLLASAGSFIRSKPVVKEIPLESLLDTSGLLAARTTAEHLDQVKQGPRFLAYTGSAAEREIMEKLWQNGYGVFIEYTAEWCITCKINQGRLLHTKRLRKLLQEHGVWYLKADLTRPNPLLERELNALQRAALPVYALYPSKSLASKSLGKSLSQKQREALLLPTFPSYQDFVQALTEVNSP